MKSKKNLAVIAGGSILFIAGLMCVGYTVNNEKEQTDDLFMANVEALSRSEIDCSYVRNEGSCTITVGADGEIKLLGGTILKADGDGKITFDGKVSCQSGGNENCTPVECIDLYEVIL